MANLGVENIGSVGQIGPEKLGGVSDSAVSREMANNGMSESDAGGKSFGDMLKDSVNKVNEMQTQSDTAIGELVAGRSKNIHETMLTIERADTSLKLAMQVRNKILDAYKEIIRMQV